ESRMKTLSLIFCLLMSSIAFAYPDEFAQRWHDAGDFGKEIGCVIRAASNMDKLAMDDVATGRILTEHGEPIRISAAKNEHEGFQIVLSPMPASVKNVSVAVSDLNGERGKIGRANITINPVGYVKVFGATPQERLCPDPLLLSPIPQLQPGENQPVWIS